MSRYMKTTTIRLDEALLDQAKREARSRGETVTSLIEKGLRLVLVRPKPVQRRPSVVIPVSKASGGVLPGVDLDNSAGLLDIMEEHK